MMEPPPGGYGSYGSFGVPALTPTTPSSIIAPPPPPPPPPPISYAGHTTHCSGSGGVCGVGNAAVGGSCGAGKLEVMELADLHHPDCKMSRQNSEQREREREHRDQCCDRSNETAANEPPLPPPPQTNDALLLTPEAYKATEAVEFIAEHLRNEDEYTQVLPSYSF